jgi:hypothetical protein
MKAKLAKYWPSIAHAGAVAVLFLNPSVQTFAASHVAYSAPIALLWGFLLHRAQSPVSK